MSALFGIRVEKGRTGRMVKGMGNFESKVMNICKAGVETQTSRGWKRMRCVSCKKYISLPVCFCDFSTQDPGAVAQDLEGHIFTDGSLEHLLAEIFIPRINWVLVRVEMGDKDGISGEIVGDSEPDTGDRKTSGACLRDHLRPPEGLR
ncbi:hypothetical protein DER44DRAFT_827574 [Fusarium oxysporum]|nr:hypothetical protein DER44DRAFT_827574 [Fusarium oxysporum]